MKEPKTYHKELHHEDWSSWSTYDYHSDHDDQINDNRIVPEKSKDYTNNEIRNEKNRKKTNPYLYYHRNSYLPTMQHDDKSKYLNIQHDMMGYSYLPQYAVHENVKEMDHNIVPYMHMYKESYHKDGESTMGHIYSNDLTKFYEDKHEDGDYSTEEYENELKETHSGRYFVDDSEYLQNDDKYVMKKLASPKMSVS